MPFDSGDQTKYPKRPSIPTRAMIERDVARSEDDDVAYKLALTEQQKRFPSSEDRAKVGEWLSDHCFNLFRMLLRYPRFRQRSICYLYAPTKRPVNETTSVTHAGRLASYWRQRTNGVLWRPWTQIFCHWLQPIQISCSGLECLAPEQ